MNTWGHEFYFDIGVQADQEPDASDVVDVGDLAYWPPGMAFCVFFGRTPASHGNEVRAASPVNVVGRIDDPPIDTSAASAHGHGDSDRGSLSGRCSMDVGTAPGLTVRLLSGTCIAA